MAQSGTVWHKRIPGAGGGGGKPIFRYARVAQHRGKEALVLVMGAATWEERQEDHGVVHQYRATQQRQSSNPPPCCPSNGK